MGDPAKATRTLAMVVADAMARTPEEPNAWEREQRERDEADARRRRRKRFDALDLPVTQADCDALLAGTIEQTRVVVAVEAWASGTAPLLLIGGTPGTGKTIAAGAAVLERGGGYVRASEAARLWLAQFGDEVEQREKLLKSHPLLVVDDIGTERDPATMTLALIEILDARRKGGVRNVWITNLSRAAFEARYTDPRLHSRIAQSGAWLVESGADRRRVIAQSTIGVVGNG